MSSMYGSNNASILAGGGLAVVARRMRKGDRIAPSERGSGKFVCCFLRKEVCEVCEVRKARREGGGTA